MSGYVQHHHTIDAFTDSESWVILSEIEQSIKHKIESVGTPLKDWDIQINYGLKTGYNDAFIIKSDVRERILANCQTEDERKRTAEIIRPILRGRDIKKYGYDWADLWLIWVPWHFPLHFDESIQGASEIAEDTFRREYPSVYAHLSLYKKQLSARNKAETGIRYEWYALQRWGAKYWDDFSKPKIIYNDIAQQLTFALCQNGEFLNNTAYFFTSDKEHVLEFLLKALNTKVLDWYYRTLSVQLGEKAVRMFSIYVLKLPIPYGNLRALDSLDDDSMINRCLCCMYGMTEEEIKFIENQ